jgi:citrate lyase beta subunit
VGLVGTRRERRWMAIHCRRAAVVDASRLAGCLAMYVVVSAVSDVASCWNEERRGAGAFEMVEGRWVEWDR